MRLPASSVLTTLGELSQFGRPIAYRQRADLNAARENPCSFPSLEAADCHSEATSRLGFPYEDFV
jgi:hypothetical protein